MTDPMDFGKMMQDAAAAFRLDPTQFQAAFKNQAGIGEKLSQVTLDAAAKSAELSAKFTRDTLAKIGDVTKAKDAPADYGKAMQEFLGGQSEAVQSQAAAFAQILRDVQTQTVELMMQAAKTAQEQGAAAMKGGKKG